MVGMEDCLPFIPRPDPNIVEPPPDVEFGEVLDTLELGDKLRY